MTRKIQKWGNSYAVRLPKATVERLGLLEGTEVDIREEVTGISITPITKPETLDELVARITPETLHESVDWGEPVGREAW